MHVLIVDDELLARKRLRKMIESIDGVNIVGEAENGEQACEAVNMLDPEVVLMDVRMPGLDGLEAARKIKDMTDPPAIVFCTAYDEYALQAFETFAAGYLVKPVQADKLSEVLSQVNRLNKAQKSALVAQAEPEEVPSQRGHISVKTRHGIELIEVATVFCFLADQKYVTVIHQDGESLIDETLKDLEEEFCDSFVRVHRNALVAVKEIVGLERVEGNHFEIKLKASEYRPAVSRRHLASVRGLLANL